MTAPAQQPADTGAINHQIESVDRSDSVDDMRDSRKYVEGYLYALFQHHIIDASSYHGFQKALEDRMSDQLDVLGEDSNVTVTYP
jgi:hypothetical protein